MAIQLMDTERKPSRTCILLFSPRRPAISRAAAHAPQTAIERRKAMAIYCSRYSRETAIDTSMIRHSSPRMTPITLQISL